MILELDDGCVRKITTEGILGWRNQNGQGNTTSIYRVELGTESGSRVDMKTLRSQNWRQRKVNGGEKKEREGGERD